MSLKTTHTLAQKAPILYAYVCTDTAYSSHIAIVGCNCQRVTFAHAYSLLHKHTRTYICTLLGLYLMWHSDSLESVR